MRQHKFLVATLLAASLFIVGCTPQQPDQSDIQGQRTQSSAEATVTWCITEPQQEEYCFEPIAFTEGESAYDTLINLDVREDGFEFEATDYGPELGYFVTSINGIAGDANNFWKLFVNNEEAQAGIGTILVNDQDKLSFEYEQVL